MTEFLANYAGVEPLAILWLVVAAVLFFTETIVPGIFFLWFGVAALLIGILALFTDIGLTAQVGLFAVLAFLNVLFARWVIGYGQGEESDTPGLNAGGGRYMGRKFIVSSAIENGRGRIKVGDTLWTAEGPDAAVGSWVEVTGARGNVLEVRPVDNGTAAAGATVQR